MNELKPEDVMRALECCGTGSHDNCDCDNCPYYRCDVPCKDKLHKDAIALLREKDAEIERLSHQCSECAGCTQWKCDCSNIRAEAITEFAQRLKKYYDALKSGLVSYHIDQIAKEMKGEHSDGNQN